jgi:predicted DNA-binding transcriptional regulator AlpA
MPENAIVSETLQRAKSETSLTTKGRRHAPLPADPPYLRTPEAAARLRLASGTLDKMRLRGNGPPYIRLTPRSVVYAVDALDAWARARQFNSTSEYPEAAACA